MLRAYAKEVRTEKKKKVLEILRENSLCWK